VSSSPSAPALPSSWRASVRAARLGLWLLRNWVTAALRWDQPGQLDEGWLAGWVGGWRRLTDLAADLEEGAVEPSGVRRERCTAR